MFFLSLLQNNIARKIYLIIIFGLFFPLNAWPYMGIDHT